MRLTWRDGSATLLVAGAAVLYALWAAGALMPGVSTRCMTVIAFALGMAACTANQRNWVRCTGSPGKARARPAFTSHWQPPSAS